MAYTRKCEIDLRLLTLIYFCLTGYTQASRLRSDSSRTNNRISYLYDSSELESDILANNLAANNENAGILKDPKVQATIQNFGRLKGFTEEINLSQFCFEACNRNSIAPCTIYYAKNDPQSLEEQRKKDRRDIGRLRPYSYIKGYPNSRDLIVTCNRCQNNTEGATCQYCKTGFWNSNDLNILKNLKDTPGRTIEEKIARMEIKCRPCQCAREGTGDFPCSPETVYEPGYTLYDPDLPDPRDKLNMRDDDLPISMPAGACFCKDGYMGRACNQCDEESTTTNKYPVTGEQKSAWQAAARQMNTTFSEVYCVDRCKSKRYCREFDDNALCEEGVCQCSRAWYGPNCEFKSANSSFRLGFSVSVILLQLWVLLY